MTSKIFPFAEDAFNADPFLQFEKWYGLRLSSEIEIPNSMSLATSSAGGRVSVRTVLLKEYDNGGFVFYTNYESKKGVQLSSNKHAALLFYWPEMKRQIRIEGVTEKLLPADSEKYFASRPRESQIAARASEQSTIIPGSNYLKERFRIISSEFHNRDIPKPENWGGYRLIPDWFEFWQDGKFRLHDRLCYTKKGTEWVMNRLAP